MADLPTTSCPRRPSRQLPCPLGSLATLSLPTYGLGYLAVSAMA